MPEAGDGAGGGELLLGAAAPGQLLERAGLGAVDGLAVDLHPFADFGQALDAGVGEHAFGGGADVEEVIAAFAGAVNQVADEGGGGFPVLVVLVVAPVVVHGHAGFPVHAGAEAGGGDFLFGRAVIADALGALVHAGHAGAGLADAVVDDDVGLEAADVVVEVHAALVGPGLSHSPSNQRMPMGP